ncbi:MAG: pantoate--beta-alanine ligase [Candidatus Zixiibacteriota bacterium]
MVEMMHRVKTIRALRRHVRTWRDRRETVAFVPTMGALHIGHERLIERARKLADRTVVSIFVNPLQFGVGEDFDAYPRPLSDDLAVCRTHEVDLVFTPDPKTVYPDGFNTNVHVGDLGDLWEGAARPGHFDGVATVVLKLFNMVQPDVAVFGQKDYQQLLIIRRIVRDLDILVRIVMAPTVRERGGLAVSSRNVYLDPPSRAAAESLYRALRWARMEISQSTTSVRKLRGVVRRMVEAGGLFELDYVAFCDRDTLKEKQSLKPPLVILIAAVCKVPGAAHGRRFIDNILVP